MKTLTHTILSALQHRTTRRPRTGKIARLPKPFRERINHLLYEGCEYDAILKDLGPQAAGLNHQNLTNWRKGGYQDHLDHQTLLERTKAQTEAAAELVHEMADVSVSQILEACDKVAATQLLDVIFEHGETALARTLQEQPAKYLNLMNIACNMNNSAIKAQEFRLKLADRHACAASLARKTFARHNTSAEQGDPDRRAGSRKANLDLIADVQAELRKRYYSSSSENPIKPSKIQIKSPLVR